MLQFQPPGFGQQVIKTTFGVMVYYTPTASPWRHGSESQSLPPLVFLHSLGGGSSAFEWSKVYPAFACNYRVMAPDLIGWGQSKHPQRSYSIADYLLMLTELLESIGEPATVIASSLSAGLTIRLATQKPELFRQLFLVAPTGYGDFGANYQQSLAAQLVAVPGVDRLFYSLGAANEWAVRLVLEQFLFADRSRITNEMVAAYLASATQLNAEYATLASLKGDLCFDLSLYIPQLTVPTQWVWGKAARLSSYQVGNRLAQLNPTFIRAFPPIEAGVLAHLEQPGLMIGLLKQALLSRHQPKP